MTVTFDLEIFLRLQTCLSSYMLTFCPLTICVSLRAFSSALNWFELTLTFDLGHLQPKDPSIGVACKLLGVDEAQMRTWICNKKITTVGETLTKPLTKAVVCLDLLCDMSDCINSLCWGEGDGGAGILVSSACIQSHLFSLKITNRKKTILWLLLKQHVVSWLNFLITSVHVCNE